MDYNKEINTRLRKTELYSTSTHPSARISKDEYATLNTEILMLRIAQSQEQKMEMLIQSMNNLNSTITSQGKK
jgi:hypothetical protein